MSRWEDFNFAQRITDILADAHYTIPNHHLGRPFLTPYQIAIEFKNRFPNDFNQINLPIGGINTGEHNSLAKYIAGQLSRRNESLPNIEGGFISNTHLNEISFKNPEQDTPIVSSLTNTPNDLSIYRYTENIN